MSRNFEDYLEGIVRPPQIVPSYPPTSPCRQSESPRTPSTPNYSQPASPFSASTPIYEPSYAGSTPNRSQPSSPYAQGSTPGCTPPHPATTPAREEQTLHYVQTPNFFSGYTLPPGSDPAHPRVYQDVFYHENTTQPNQLTRQVSGSRRGPVHTVAAPFTAQKNGMTQPYLMTRQLSSNRGPSATIPSTDHLHAPAINGAVMDHNFYNGPRNAGPLNPGPLNPGPLCAGPLSTGPRSAGPRSADFHAAVYSLPQLVITGEPESEHRFRYTSEGTSHGVLMGKKPGSTITVQLKNYCNDNGYVHVKATLYTVDCSRKHFHKLKGKHCTSSGECILTLQEDNSCSFSNLSVLRTENKIAQETLFQEKLSLGGCHQSVSPAEVNYFMNEAKKEAKALQLNLARIRFTAFDVSTNKNVAPHVFSEPIVNTKSPLKITRISKMSSDCVGGKLVFLLCEAVNKKDIKVRFYETDQRGKLIWEDFGTFGDSDVHHQVAIVFKTPAYKDQNLRQQVKVQLQLSRRGGTETSAPIDFYYKPSNKDPDGIQVKKQKDPDYGQFGSGHSAVGPSSRTVQTASQNTEPETGLGHALSSDTVPFYQLERYFNKGDFGEFPPGAVEYIQSCLRDLDVYSEDMDLDFEEALFQTDCAPETSLLPSKEPKGSGLQTDSFPRGVKSEMEKESTELPQSEFETDSTPSFQAYNSFRLESEPDTKSLIRDFKNIDVLYDVVSESKQSLRDSKPDFQKFAKETENSGKVSELGPSRCRDDRDSSDLSKSPDKVIGTGDQAEDRTGANRKRETRQSRISYCRKILACKLLEILQGFWKQKVNSLSENLRRFSSTGDVKALLSPLAEFLGNKNTDGDNAIHLAVIHQPKNRWMLQHLMQVVWLLKNRSFLNSKNNLFQTPLHLAVSVGETSLVKLLLSSGADPNCQDRKGNTPSQSAVLKKDKDCLATLLNEGYYNVRCKGQPLPDLDIINYSGYSALHLSVLTESMECLSLLLESGADPNKPEGTGGRRALHLAAEMRSPLVSRLLQQSGTEVDAQDFAGNSPLHLACSFHHHETALLLVQAGAGPSLRNWIQNGKREEEEEDEDETDDEEEDTGRTPSDFALGDPQMESILEKAFPTSENRTIETHSRPSSPSPDPYDPPRPVSDVFEVDAAPPSPKVETLGSDQPNALRSKEETGHSGPEAGKGNTNS